MPKKEFFSFTTSRGTQLNGWMMKPANFDASQKYPVLQYQYSGPGSQQVQDQFSVSWETYMASQGYIVVCSREKICYRQTIKHRFSRGIFQIWSTENSSEIF